MDFTEQLDSYLRRQTEDNLFSGVVLIQQDASTTIFHEAYGPADRTWNVANRPDTRFRIASVSKMFTALAVLQQIAAGNLDLDMVVQEALALEKGAIPEDVTVRHLLTMTAGIADWFDESRDWEEVWEELSREHAVTLLRRNRDYLPLFTHKAPLAPSGQRYRYNNAGFILLGLLLEQVARQPYGDYICDHVFEPAGMRQTAFLALDEVERNVAEGYIPQSEDEQIVGWKRNIYAVTPAPAADGGATSSAADLCRFLQTLRQGQLLSERMAQLMLTPQVLESEERHRGYTWMYGFGNEFLLDDQQQTVRYGHTGEEDGISCRLYHYPRPQLDVAILGNQSWCAGRVGWYLHDLIIENFQS